MKTINQHQPHPVSNANDAIWDLVVADMKDRDNTGRERYGTPLQGFNGRDALVDAYQEALDMVVYLRQAIWERDFGKENVIVASPDYPEVPLTQEEIDEVTEVGTIRRPFRMTTESAFI